MTGQAKLKFLFGIVCDDVRREDNGKELILGVYSGSILVPTFPSNLMLSFWAQYQASAAGHSVMDARVLSAQRTTLVQLKLNIDVSDVGCGSIYLPPLPIQVQSHGELHWQIKQEGQDWETIKSIPVVTPTAVQLDVMAKTAAFRQLVGRPPAQKPI